MAQKFTQKLDQADAKQLIARRHPEWLEHQRRWRWLQDSLEGGDRYRHADYAPDPTADPPPGSLPWYQCQGVDPTTSEPLPFSYKQIVDRNLVPHLSETGADGRDIYALRLHRTPVPTNLARAVRSHTSRIFAREVVRSGPPPLVRWWADVDGSGRSIDQWMRQVVAPLFLALGQLDLVFDHPEPPEGVRIETRADLRAHGLDACTAGIILPENLVWWRLERRSRRYRECLVFERGDDGGPRYRHWTESEVHVYDASGRHLPECSYAHPFGVVPIVRVFDARKARCGNVGQSRYEAVAELQKAIYNATSELILGDTEQSHAQLSGPEDFLQRTAEVPIGPGNILPKKKNTQGGSVSYEGWEFVEPPKGAQAEVRRHILDWGDQADREAALLKPAGLTAGSTVAQSGVSKLADQQDGNALLAEIAEALACVEREAARMALVVLSDGEASEADRAAIAVAYPRQFDLFTAADLADALQDLQAVAARAGALPETETEMIQRLVTIALPGLPDGRQAALRGEIAAFVRARAASRGRPAAEDENDISTKFS